MGLLDSLREIRPQGPDLSRFDKELAAIEESERENLSRLGAWYMKAHGGEPEEEARGFAEQAAKLAEEKKQVNARRLAAQGLRECPGCGRAIPADSLFCNQCGEKLEPLKTENPSGRFCASCGARLEPGDKFCTSCGAKAE